VCQDVCPWNQKVPAVDDPAFQPQPDTDPLDVVALLALDEAAFRARFKHTPLWRAKRRGLLRNAAIVLGNQRDPATLPVLIRALDDDEPLVRGACAWALGRFDDERARNALRARRSVEQDPDVIAEMGAETPLPLGEGSAQQTERA
jgi:epoxyqueuosine reductase